MRLVAVVAVAVAAVAAAAAPVRAASQQGCAQKLLNDYFDGRIEGSYQVACFERAIHALPVSVVYGGDPKPALQRALDLRVEAAQKSGVRIKPTTVLAPRALAAAPVAATKTRTPVWRLALMAILGALLVAWVAVWWRRRRT